MMWNFLRAMAFTLGLFIFFLRRIFQQTLSEDEQNQAELDMYMKSNFSNIEIGTLYERYIGHTFEKKDYYVRYNGALKGFGDQGRDLVIMKNEQTWIVQAKCWAQHKIIHENVVFQLYGSTEHYKKEKNKSNVRALIYTTASCSEKAKEAAHLLGIEIRFEKLNPFYPMIKCHISDETKEKTYYFPLDENYDSIRIRPYKGEFFAATVQEAVASGFRRTQKYKKAA